MQMDIHDLYARLSPRFRAKRMNRFAEEFRIESQTRVLDVGGSHHIWTLLPVRPRVVLLNLSADDERGHGFTNVLGDARRLPFKDHAFDLIFSNSLIEHLYTLDQQQQFADECRRVAARYYIQVPNQRFFIEPHLLTPFIHWLPKRAQVRLMRNFTVHGLITRPGRTDCQQFVKEVRLLTRRDLRRLFPEAEIWSERVLGMSKSLMAVKSTP
jgi:SAM-dependent methyltransferase